MQELQHYNQMMKEAMDIYHNAPRELSVQTTLTAYKPKPFGEKRTYSQDWPTYYKASRSEKMMFLKILKDAVDYLEIGYEYKGNGRPPAYYGDIVKSLCIKAYHNYSCWRLESELKIARAMGIIEFIPKRSTVNKYMKDPKINKMLNDLYKIIAEPISLIETHFSADATGIKMKYGNKRWINVRHTKEEMKQVRNYVKLHIISGVKTNCIVRCKITKGQSHESPFFKELIDDTAKVFNVKEVSADSGYLSKKNVRAIANVGAVPYIKPKKNTCIVTKGTGAWVDMMKLWKRHQNYFYQRYHLRSNVESTFSALKRKLTDYCRCKQLAGQENEILCKIVCFNAAILSRNLLSYDLKKGFLK